MKSSRRLPRGRGSGSPNAPGLFTTATAISTAAMPTSECIAATSSGICVICTRRATNAPTMPPIAMATRMNATFLVMGERHQNGDRHADHAEEVPAPRRYGRGQAFQREDERNARREYQSASWLRSCLLLLRLRRFFLNISSMRCVTRKPPKTFDRGKPHRDRSEDRAEIGVVGAGGQDRADDDHARNRVRHASISGVCRAGVTFQITWVADEHGQHEHHEVDDGRVDGFRSCRAFLHHFAVDADEARGDDLVGAVEPQARRSWDRRAGFRKLSRFLA